jgi:hypothetical protein
LGTLAPTVMAEWSVSLMRIRLVTGSNFEPNASYHYLCSDVPQFVHEYSATFFEIHSHRLSIQRNPWKQVSLQSPGMSQSYVLGYRTGGPGSIPGTTRKKIVGLERGPLSLVSTTEELLDRKVAAPVQKTENTAVGNRHADHVAPSIRKKLAITSPTSGGRSIGIVRSRIQAMEFSLVFNGRKNSSSKHKIIIQKCRDLLTENIQNACH